jgi:hypothetical protein
MAKGQRAQGCHYPSPGYDAQAFLPRKPTNRLRACLPQPCLQVEWQSPDDPTRGFRYLYLTPEDHASLTARAPPGATLLRANRLVTEAGEERYQLTGGPVAGGTGA